VDRWPEHGRCQLKKGQGGRCFRRRAATCCGGLLARLRAAGWSGAEGASDAWWTWSGDVLPGLMVGVQAGETGDRQRSVHGMATGPGANENSIIHSEPIFPWISLTTCSVKCPHEIQI
jgi:hypothetical protein